MNKLFWFDVETTGTNPYKHDIVQLAYLIEIDGEIVSADEILMAPMSHIDASASEALAVSGRTVEEVKKYPDAADGLKNLKKELEKHVDKYNKKDKFIAAGYNVRFDIDFLRQAFIKTGDKYFGSWFHWPSIDVAGVFAVLLANGDQPDLKDFKLETLCKHYGIDITAHDAVSDIKATRELYLKLKSKIPP